MKFLALLALLLSPSTFANKGTIYDAFMCYTQVDMVVLFGILKPEGTLRINYQRLEENPTTIDLKINQYNRSNNIIDAIGLFEGKPIIKVYSQNGFGSADIDLTPFRGTEDVSFNNEDVMCYFGKFED